MSYEFLVLSFSPQGSQSFTEFFLYFFGRRVIENSVLLCVLCGVIR